MSEGNKNTAPEQPAENIPKEIIAVDETHIPGAKPVAIDQPQTIHPKLQTDKMEVHHHGHVHEKKKWKEYVFQFLMLFLAVFCGFLAENQREHMVEHQREKKFIKSLVIDLEVDTARLNDILLQRHRRAGMLDSFVTLLNKQDAAAYGRYLYYFNSFATRGAAFRYTPVDGTMQQLKNAGNLRLIRKSAVNDSIKCL